MELLFKRNLPFCCNGSSVKRMEFDKSNFTSPTNTIIQTDQLIHKLTFPSFGKAKTDY